MRRAGAEPSGPGRRAGWLIMLVGPPASGKSYLARRLVTRLDAELIQTDVLRKALFRQPCYSARENGAVYAEARRRIARSLQAGRTMIFDATNLSEHSREQLYRLAETTGAGLTVLLIYAPLDVIRQRLSAREAGADPYDRSEADWEVFQKLGRADPIRRPHLLVNTAVDLGQAVELVAAHRVPES